MEQDNSPQEESLEAGDPPGPVESASVPDAQVLTSAASEPESSNTDVSGDPPGPVESASVPDAQALTSAASGPASSSTEVSGDPLARVESASVTDAQALAAAASGPASSSTDVEMAAAKSLQLSISQGNQDNERDELLKRDYTITFPTIPGPELMIKIENLTPLSKKRYDDSDSPEELTNFFGMITRDDQRSDLELAKTLWQIHAAGCFTHTYSAKSGTNYRVTRISMTESRLRKFADGIEFVRGFDPVKIEEACRNLKSPKTGKPAPLELENPDLEMHPEAKNWYKPYEHLSGPYRSQKDHLYVPMTSGERMKIARLLMTGDTRMICSHRQDDAFGCGLDIAKMEEEGANGGFCLGFFPIHNDAEKAALQELWMPLKLGQLCRDYSNYEILPSKAIMEYFGEEVGFYFAFLSHYCYCLLPMVPVAIGFQCWQIIELTKTDNTVLFSSAWAALIFTIAYSLILNKWSMDQSALAHRWHAYDAHGKLPPRPGFQGMILKNPATGKIEVDFPAAERRKKVIRTLAVSLSLVLLLAGVIGLIFFYRAASGDPILPPLLNAVQITIFGIVYGKIAEALTEFENHKTILDFNSALFRKLVFCYFVSNFAAPFYIAFIKSGVDGCPNFLAKDDDGPDFCGLELMTTVAFAFLGNDFGGRMGTSLVIPRLMGMYAKWEASNDKTVDFANMGPTEKQYRLLSPYDPTRELIMDYIELYVQWGYLTLFGASCPFVVAFAFITNLVETRTDGAKLLNDFRRVLPNRVDGIGEPLNMFYYVLYAAVPTNCALIVYTFGGATKLELSSQGSVWLLLFLGICLSFMHALLHTVYPTMPSKTATQLIRQEVVYRRAILEEEEVENDLPDEFKDGMHFGKQVKDVESGTSNPMPGAGQADGSKNIMKITLA